MSREPTLVPVEESHPTMEELEFLQQARERIRLIIRARWILTGILAAFGAAAWTVLRREGPELAAVTPGHRSVAILAILFVVAYNGWYQYSYRWFARFRSFNAVQILFDLLVVTVLVHFSGGAVSWFWAMYLVLTLEAAILLDRPSDPYAIALAGAVGFGVLIVLEYHGLVPPVPVPFENTALQQVSTYGMVKWAFVSAMNFCAAFVGVFLMDSVRRREAKLRELSVRDALTGLYNRGYFFYRFRSEIQRAKRYGRTVSLLILDVDDFKRFNDAYGHLAGDNLLRSVAEVLAANIRRSDATPSYEVDIACRYGGEEFALILPEAAAFGGRAAAERIRTTIETQGALVVAERIRRQIEAQRQGSLPLTVSIGVASYPEHGVDLDTLLRMADDAMYAAKRQGKNRVAVAGMPEEPPPEPGGRDG